MQYLFWCLFFLSFLSVTVSCLCHLIGLQVLFEASSKCNSKAVYMTGTAGIPEGNDSCP